MRPSRPAQIVERLCNRMSTLMRFRIIAATQVSLCSVRP